MQRTEIAFPPLPLLIALLQGLALMLLHQAIEFDFWPDQQPNFLFSFYTITIVAPTLYLLAYRDDHKKEFSIRVAVYTAVCAALAFYVGYQALPVEQVQFDQVLAPMVFTFIITSLLALVYLEAQSESEPFQFHWLFRRAWRHTLTLAFSLLFTLLSWGVFMLWGALFKAIDVDFFIDLFTERWFYYPVLGLLNGLGIVLFRKQYRIIDTVIKLVHIIMWFLLVPLSFVSLIFLMALPFTGLSPLWDSGGSWLILWMQILLIVFANMVAQDGDLAQLNYPRWLNTLALSALVVMPIYSAISYYGITLRIGQYGWSVERCWAMLIWFVVAVFALVYSVSVLRKREQWFAWASKANVFIGLGLIALLWLVNSPLMDFRKISVNSQLARITPDSSVDESLDLSYFRYELARPGYLALQTLKHDYADSQPVLAVKIDQLYRDNNAFLNLDEFKIRVSSHAPIPEDLWPVMFEQQRKNRSFRDVDSQLHLIAADVQGDEQLEYILLDVSDISANYQAYYRQEERWHFSHARSENLSIDTNETELRTGSDGFLTALTDKQWHIESAKWRSLEINGYQLRFEE